MKIKAIIFDMDGTVIDTEHIWIKATRDLIHHRNIVLSQEEHDAVMNHSRGIGLTQGCCFLKERFKFTDAIPDLARELGQRAHSHFTSELRFIDGFTTFHKKIMAQGLKNGLATNADDTTLLLANKALNLSQFFGEHMYNVSHVNNRAKPDPALYLHAAEKLAIDPAHCIAIEDSAHGIAAAKNAGIFCLGINTAKNVAALKHADLIIEGYDNINLTELEKLLGKN